MPKFPQPRGRGYAQPARPGEPTEKNKRRYAILLVINALWPKAWKNQDNSVCGSETAGTGCRTTGEVQIRVANIQRECF